MGSMNLPIRIGEVAIAHDDMIFGDENGVVVVPDSRWAEVEAAAWDVLANEQRIRIMAAQGRDVEQILAECGAF